MVTVEIKELEEFRVCGKKCYISGQDNEQFAEFWKELNENGTVEELKRNSISPLTNHTKSAIMGISRVENDPKNRAFDFYIASECESLNGFDSFVVPASKWAIFKTEGDVSISALIDSEMFAFMKWLPSSIYEHALAPEIEVYPFDNGPVQFWLPIVENL